MHSRPLPIQSMPQELILALTLLLLYINDFFLQFLVPFRATQTDDNTRFTPISSSQNVSLSEDLEVILGSEKYYKTEGIQDLDRFIMQQRFSNVFRGHQKA